MVDDNLDRDELEDAVIEKFEAIYENDLSWHFAGHDHFIRDVSELSDETLGFMLDASDDDIMEYGQYGFGDNQEEPPEWLEEMGWYDDDGEWHNPFWYH